MIVDEPPTSAKACYFVSQKDMKAQIGALRERIDDG